MRGTRWRKGYGNSGGLPSAKSMGVIIRRMRQRRADRILAVLHLRHALPDAPMVAEPQQFAPNPEWESLPRAATVNEKLIKVCAAGLGVVPLQRDEIDDSGILRRKGARVHVERQSVEPSVADRQQMIYRLCLAIPQPGPRPGGRSRRRRYRHLAGN